MTHTNLSKLLSGLDIVNAKRHDPVRFAYLESLATKSGAKTSRALQDKILEDAKQFQQELEQARRQAEPTSHALIIDFPKHKQIIQALISNGEFKTLTSLDRRLRLEDVKRKNLSPLKQLTNQLSKSLPTFEDPHKPTFDEQLEQQRNLALQNANQVEAAAQSKPKKPDELRSMRMFRQSIKHADIDKVIARAINECPENPGPHNPHMLAIKSLTQLRELSPSYLRRFAGYIEVVQWLDKCATKLANDKRSF